MNKKELFDALDGFSQNLLVTLAEVEAIKKNLKQVIEENTALRLENDKLRERLGDCLLYTSSFLRVLIEK